MIGDKAANEPPFSLGLPPMPATYTDRLQGLSTSVAVKAPCRVATTANITLSGLQTIDGVLVSAGDRVLVKDQADPIENGIYDASSSDWHRALDFDGSRDVVGGTQVSVVEGALSPESYWRVTGAGAPRPGVDAIHFEVALFSVGSLIGFIAANRTILAGIVPAAAGQVAYLTESGREGAFIWRTGNYAALVGNDPLQGIYVKNSVISSSQGCWVRVWDRIHGIPEWFGAVADGATDCLAALQSCVANCPVSMLGIGDYKISATWVINTGWRKVRGQGTHGYSTGQGTRILMADGSVTIIQVGPSSSPGASPGVNFTRGITIENIQPTRTVQNIPNAAAADSPTAVLCQWLYDCHFRQVAPWDSAIGFKLYACVTCYFDDCFVHRGPPTSILSNDIAYGYLQADSTPILAGNNASIYYRGCLAELPVGNISFSAGWRIEGEFTDTFLDGCETVYEDRGISVVGTGSGGISTSNVDLRIRGMTIDQPYDYGITFESLAPSAIVEIIDPYFGMPASGLAGIYFFNGGGHITLTGGEMLGFTGGSTIGLFCNQQSGVTAKGFKIMNAPRACVMDTCTDFDLNLQINNPTVASWNGSGATAAIFISSSSIEEVRASVKGMANAFAQGVNLSGAGNSKIEVNCTRINPACLTGGANNKLVANTVQITSTGAFDAGAGSNCLAAGIMV